MNKAEEALVEGRVLGRVPHGGGTHQVLPLEGTGDTCGAEATRHCSSAP